MINTIYKHDMGSRGIFLPVLCRFGHSGLLRLNNYDCICDIDRKLIYTHFLKIIAPRSSRGNKQVTIIPDYLRYSFKICTKNVVLGPSGESDNLNKMARSRTTFSHRNA